MKIGWIGLGKLGLPCALVMEQRGGHHVTGYDASPEVREAIMARTWPHQEAGLPEMLASSALTLADSIADVVAHSEVVFVAVQTPHGPEYEGVTPLPDTRADFEYRYLRAAVSDIAEAAKATQRPVIVAVVSTVLPGTMAREILPVLNPSVRLIYNPSFIAMGTTIHNFAHPEFTLIGGADTAAIDTVASVYGTIHDAPIVRTSIVTAELAKVGYNVAIGLKIVMANALMEICHKVGANIDDVTTALSLATDRIISAKYLRGGMGDAGNCHPRDGIALSWLAETLDLSYDLFGAMMEAREAQARWLASLAIEQSLTHGLPVVVLGEAYKPGTNLVGGSCGRLLVNLLAEHGVSATIVDPHVHGAEAFESAMQSPAVFVVATEHDAFHFLTVPKRSVVIDPWRSVISNADHYLPIGRAS